MSAIIRPAHSAPSIASEWTPNGTIPDEIRYIVVRCVGPVDPPKAHISIGIDGSLAQGAGLDQPIPLPCASNWKDAPHLADHCISVQLVGPAAVSNMVDNPYPQAQYHALELVVRSLALTAPHLRDLVMLHEASIGTDPSGPPRLDLGQLRAFLPNHAHDFGPVYRVNIAHGDRLFVRAGPAQRWGATGALLSGDLIHLHTRAYRHKDGHLRETGWALISANHSTQPLGFVDTDHLIAVPNVDALIGVAQIP